MAERSSSAGTSTPKTGLLCRPDWPGLASGVLLAAVTFAVYRRTFSVPLLWDDNLSIAQNPTIRHLWPLWPVFSPPNEAGVGGRPLLNFSYALNYAFGGASVSGYHAVNLVIHILAGLTLFGIVRRTIPRWSALRSPPKPGDGGSPTRSATPSADRRVGDDAPHPTLLALAVSAIWAWHPVQTESVTYLSQRAESLMGLFYLLTLYCFIRHADGEERAWAILSILACLAGVGAKEVIVTAPLLVFLYDRTFVSGTFANAWRRHTFLYSGLAATWLPLGILMIGLHHRGVGFGQGAAWWAYGLTECRVLVKYLLLAFWPIPLVFDYGNSVVASRLSEVWPSALVLAALLFATGRALFFRPAERGRVRLGPSCLGFAGAWFFLILAPASSVVPVANQPMAENRLYLPLAGVAAFAVVGAFALAGRRCLPVFAVIAAGLGLASAQRNRDYASGPAIWSDTIAKVPASARAHGNLGYELAKVPGRLNDAIAEYETAVRLQPDFAPAHYNLGTMLERIPGRLDEAIAQYREALGPMPEFAEAHENLGNALATAGRLPEAIAQYEAAVRLRPDEEEGHYNLANALKKMPGRQNEAIAQYEEAIRLRPDSVEAHNNLGNALDAAGRTREAIGQYAEALRLNPDYVPAHLNLALALLKTPGRASEAAAQVEAVLRLQPGNEGARQLLSRIKASSP